jgi:hypothetical protein
MNDIMPCTATRVNPAGITEYCTQEAGHDGQHHDGPCEGWNTEAELREALAVLADENNELHEQVASLERCLAVSADYIAMRLHGPDAVRVVPGGKD